MGVLLVAANPAARAAEIEAQHPAAADPPPDAANENGSTPNAAEASSDDAATNPERVEVRRNPIPADDLAARYYRIKESTKRQLQSGQESIHIYQLAEEMVDDLVDDLKELRPEVVSPMALRGVSVSANLSGEFTEVLEANILSAVANSTPVAIKHCVACRALRSKVEGGDWVVRAGVVEQDQLRAEAAHLNVKTFLDVSFSFFPSANTVVLQVEIFRADDSRVLWAETYRSDATTAAILRTGDRILTRRERVAELERKLEARPYYGHIAYGGVAHIPYDSPLGGITGASAGYRLYEKFGEERRWLFGIGAEVFANLSKSNPLLGSFIGMTILYEILPPDLNNVVIRTGPTAEGFFAGTEGNSWAVEWGVDVLLQFRLGAGVSAMYFKPTEFAGSDLGGFGGKVRASFNW